MSAGLGLEPLQEKAYQNLLATVESTLRTALLNGWRTKILISTTNGWSRSISVRIRMGNQWTTHSAVIQDIRSWGVGKTT